MPDERLVGEAAFLGALSRVVFICARSFLEMALNAPERAEATVIHEMLHSLGLGENPPSSRDITERVLFRCASPPARVP